MEITSIKKLFQILKRLIKLGLRLHGQMKDVFDVFEWTHNGSSLTVHGDKDFINLIQGILQVSVYSLNLTHDLGDSTRFSQLSYSNYDQHSDIRLFYEIVSDEKIL